MRQLFLRRSLSERRIAIIVLRSASWPRMQKSIFAIQAAVDRASVGTYEEIQIPYPN